MRTSRSATEVPRVKVPLVCCAGFVALVVCLTASLGQEVKPAAASTAPAATNAVAAPAQPETVAPAPPTTAATNAVAATNQPEAVAPASGSGRVGIDYVEADIQKVLRNLAALADVNLIMGDEVIGKVTVHLEGVSYEDALRLIAESKGYIFVKDRNIVRVISRESLQTEPLELRPFTLNYAKAEEVRKSLESAVSNRGKIQVDVRSNTLIISDTAASLARLEPLIERLDAQTPQVLIEAKFVETTRNPKKDLGINWAGTLLNHQLTAGSTAVAVDPATGKPVAGFQLSKNLGNPAGPWIPSTALLDGGQAQLVFSYLNQDTDTELLANPRVVTTDNGKAKIAIATQYPIPQFTYSETKGAFTISGFEYKDIGIVLNVTPHINKNQLVTLDVAPEAGSQSGVANFQGVNIPIIDNRTAMTTVLIKSGNTLAMGGLMRQDSTDGYTKVPIMGDIPGIGVFFRSKSLSKLKRNLLIFVTPTIVAPEGKTGLEKYYNGFPPQEEFSSDKWMPKDNAKPRPIFDGKTDTPASAPPAAAAQPAPAR